MSGIGQIHKSEYDQEIDRTGSIAMAQAPGRIHFLGEQNGPEAGLFLSAAIDKCVQLAVSFRKDSSFRFFAANPGERKRSTFANLKYRREDRWANSLKTAIFLFNELGCPMKGLNFSFCSNIPQGIGLASSTAIEVAAAIALKSLFHVPINDLELANRLCRAHISLFDRPAALVDYQVCILGRKSQFLLIDNSKGSIKKIKSPLGRYNILLIDSRVPRPGAESELVSRRNDSLRGLEYLSHKGDGTAFRDFESADLLEALGDFPEQIRRRSMHVVEEIRRVNDAAEALEKNDIASLSKLIFHSHESLRDLYEISCPEVDWLVKRAQEMEGTAGSRMTGLGFGGCTYTIILKSLVGEYKKRLEEYERIFGFRPVFYEIMLDTGAKILKETKKRKEKKPVKKQAKKPAMKPAKQGRRANANSSYK